jgi:transcription termination factor 2
LPSLESILLKQQLRCPGQLGLADIQHPTWQQLATDRDSWRSTISKASLEFEARRSEASRQKRQRQKERATAQVPSTEAFICPKCNRSCASRIGLFSHQRACRM